jgi:hypothetical protein
MKKQFSVVLFFFGIFEFFKITENNLKNDIYEEYIEI